MDLQLKKAEQSMREALVHSAIVGNAIDNLTKADAIILVRGPELERRSKEVYLKLVTLQTELAVYLSRWPYVDGGRVEAEKRAIEEVKVQLSVLSDEKKDLESKTLQVVEFRTGLNEVKVKYDAQIAIARAHIESKRGPVFN